MTKDAAPEQPGLTPAPELWYPNATKTAVGMKTLGDFPRGFPLGAVIHTTAGQYKTAEHALDAMRTGAKEGHCFVVIGPEGEILQDQPFSKWGQHAGTSRFPGLKGNVSDELVGIEICNPGILGSKKEDPQKTYTWWGALVQAEELKSVARPRYTFEVPGFYAKANVHQELSLLHLLLWMKSQAPHHFDFNNVVGHDEVRGYAGLPGDKSDPGGALSWGMPGLRKALKEIWGERL